MKDAQKLLPKTTKSPNANFKAVPAMSKSTTPKKGIVTGLK